jgi:hypothetical protein
MSLQNAQAIEKLYATDPVAANTYCRNQLAATALKQSIALGTTQLTAGGTTTIPLRNYGLLESIDLFVEFAYTVASGPAVLSPMGMLNALTKIEVTDFAGTPRITAPATLIDLVMGKRYNQKPFSLDANIAAIGGAETFGAAQTFVSGSNSYASIPSAGLANGAQTSCCFLRVPIARNPEVADFTGILDVQSTQGQALLKISLAALFGAAGNETLMFNTSASVTLTSAQVTVQQNFLLPQPDPHLGNTLPIPRLDVNTVYEIAGLSIPTGWATGQENFVSLPNNRQVEMAVAAYYNNNLLGGGSTAGQDIARHRVLLNGATAITDKSQILQYMHQRKDYQVDWGRGLYYWDFTGAPNSGRSPVVTNQLGNVQIGLTPATVVASPFLSYATVSTYANGSSLGALAPVV